jgi:V/A-type H+-transporting ATPase subunit I
MMHLRAQTPSRDAGAATRALAREGMLHLVDLAHGRAPAPGRTLETLATFRDLERRVNDVARLAGHRVADPTGAIDTDETSGTALDAQALDARLRPVEHAVDELAKALSAARERRASLKDRLRGTERLAAAGVDPARLASLRFLDLRLGRAREVELAELASLLAPAPYAIVPLAREGDGWLFAAAGPASGRQRLDAALRAIGCELLPPAPPGAAIGPGELDGAEAEVARLETSLAEAGRAHAALLDELASRAQLGVLLVQAQTHFAEVGRFVVISGWLPARDAPRLAQAIRDATGGRAIVELSKPEDVVEVAAGRLRVPILHRNPVLLRPFQRLIGLYGTPEYREIEPTPFFALSFLLMFGVMFGDIGHGAVLFSAGWFAFRHFPRFLDYGILLMEGGVSSIVFGFLYGSLFGREELLPALWMRPMHDLERFLMVAVVLGAVLISVGLVLNVINTWRAGDRTRALFGMQGLAGASLYWVALAVAARAFLPHPFRVPAWVPIALLAVPVILIAARPIVVRRLRSRGRSQEAPHGPRWLRALEGSIDLVDTLFSFFSNTFSFARVAAFAAVHAGIFLALNAIADTVAGVRFGGVLSVLTLIAGNIVVIFLEGLTVSVQVLRLEYYEFFTRFFRGGGEPYRPFSLRGADEKGLDHERKHAQGARGGGAPGAAGPGGAGDLGPGGAAGGSHGGRGTRAA